VHIYTQQSVHDAKPGVIASQPKRLMIEAPPPNDTTSPQTPMQGKPNAIIGDEQDLTQGLNAGGCTLMRDATPYQGMQISSAANP
jgi:hypothetical protein